ncbi:eukaryotic translation initiation factor 3 subunit E-like [Hydractinia symbiolongicarpus]|uniref:eukaryotic translation initiation factor 3 subunit E-like n=1 Tax=Hydractinia symbiolongicarpus TaxID=13093 RepID=UPI0025519D6B|nr:eukaryotic translation initiation factor 3 subunit E-like [Hydractinia symbiolongicarpus]
MAEKYDLTSRVGAYLDRHLVFPLLEFLSSKEIYDETELLKGRLELLQGTNMLDFVKDEYQRLHQTEEVPEELMERRQEVIRQMKELEAATETTTAAFDDPDFQNEAANARDGVVLFKYLNDNFGITSENLATLYQYAKFQYECGNYSGASQYLYFYRVLVHDDDKNAASAIWGKLACEILTQNWDAALEDINRLKEIIDGDLYSHPLQLLQQRTWLIHWSLFVFFNHAKGRDLLIDMFLYQPNYLNAIQTTCPHILRYLTTAVITNKRRKQILKDLVRVIQQESYTYRDPITEFLECLYVNFDFDGAQKKLVECETVLLNDFFLIACLDDFIENARLFIFETFCRIHQCISINMLAEKLNMSPEEAERWIVNLIRNARLDAKIDSKQGHVVMGTQAAAVHQQVIERTKGLMYRTQMVSASIDKKLASLQKQPYSEPFAMAWGTYDG